MVEKGEKIWKKFLRNHWKMLALIIAVLIVAAIGALYVFLWFVGEAQATSLIPSTLGALSFGYLLTFFLNLIFWEIIYIVIPLIIATILIYAIWWKRIPELERKEYRSAKLFGKRSKRTDGEGAFSFLIFVVFMIKIWFDGNWGLTFNNWDVDYLVWSWLWALIIIAVIFGIPILIGGSWWLNREMKKVP